MVTWCKQSAHWKSPWCWERLKAEEEGIRRWDGWMASLMQWTWTWANFGRWWGTGRPGVQQSMGSQRIRHEWATEQQYYWALTKLYLCCELDYHMIFSFNSHDHTGTQGPSVSLLYKWENWSTFYTTLVSHWPRCRPGLCLDFATDFVTINTLHKPELPTSTWQTHIGSCRLLITTLSCYCHPRLSEQFLSVPKMAKRGTAAVWEVQAQVCHGRSPVQKGIKPVWRLHPRQPAGLWARWDSSICLRSCVPRVCTQWVYSLHTESKLICDSCDSSQNHLWSWSLIRTSQPHSGSPTVVFPSFTYSSFNAQHLPPFAATVAVITSTAQCVWGWDPRLGFSSLCLSPNWHLLFVIKSCNHEGMGAARNIPLSALVGTNEGPWWCSPISLSASRAWPVRKHLGCPQGRLPALPTLILVVTQGKKGKRASCNKIAQEGRA